MTKCNDLEEVAVKSPGTLAIFLMSLLSAGAPAAAQTENHPAATTASIHHFVSTNAQAQAAFDRGLLDYYAYNPEAAEHEFYTAADLDDHSAMAYWGIAISNAPNLNVDATDDRAEQAREAIEQAKDLESYASAEDRALIDAASARFDDKTKATPQALQASYRDALQRIAQAYPSDPDVAALYLEAALYAAVDDVDPDTLTPAQQAARVAQFAALLPLFQASLSKFPRHVGLLHFYVHTAQFAEQSAVAVPAATKLASFTLPAEDSHLTHMPGHIFFDVGMYQPALGVARRSVAMDYADFACCHPGYYSGPRYYHEHNVSFLLYALIETGHADQAVAAARRDGNAVFMATTLVAAGDWQAVLSVPNPDGNQRTLPFAKGVAYAKLGKVAMAQASLNAIADAPASSPYNAAVVEAMRLTLSAAIASSRHDDANALQLLADASNAATKAERLRRTEYPPLYYYSPHMALAQLAMQLGKPDVAKAALQAELSDSPGSPAALSALHRLDSAASVP